MIDVIDSNRALIDGPGLGVPRHAANFKNLAVTDLTVKVGLTSNSVCGCRVAWGLSSSLFILWISRSCEYWTMPIVRMRKAVGRVQRADLEFCLGRLRQEHELGQSRRRSRRQTSQPSGTRLRGQRRSLQSQSGHHLTTLSDSRSRSTSRRCVACLPFSVGVLSLLTLWLLTPYSGHGLCGLSSASSRRVLRRSIKTQQNQRYWRCSPCKGCAIFRTRWRWVTGLGGGLVLDLGCVQSRNDLSTFSMKVEVRSACLGC